MSEAKKEAAKRAKMIADYTEALSARIELARSTKREVKALVAKYLAADKKLRERQERAEGVGEESGVYGGFQISDSLDLDEALGTFTDLLESLTEDERALPELHRSVREANEEDEANEKEEQETDEGEASE